MLKWLEMLGDSVNSALEYIGGIVILLYETLTWIARGNLRLSQTIYQMAFLGVNSLAIVVLTTGFAGMVISLEIVDMAVRYGLGGYVGGGVAISMAREFAPMLMAIVVAGRAGAAITAEVASMKVTEQIDAMRAMATSPVKYLVVPRFLANLAMFPILTIIANFAGDFGGALVGNMMGGISPENYLNSIRNILELKDIWAGIYKALVFSVLVSMISCYQGLTAEGGAAGVGKATTGSVVYSIIMIFMANFFLSAWLF